MIDAFEYRDEGNPKKAVSDKSQSRRQIWGIGPVRRLWWDRRSEPPRTSKEPPSFRRP